MLSPLYFLHDPAISRQEIERVLETIRSLFDQKATALPCGSEETEYGEGATIFAMVPDDFFVQWFRDLAEKDVTVVLLPYPSNPLQKRSFSLPSTPQEAIREAADGSLQTVEGFVRCNGEPVLGCVSVGDTRWLGAKGIVTFLRRLFSMRLRGIRITTESAQEVRTAALMIEAGHEAQMTLRRSYFFKSSDNLCRRVAAVVYAPQSIPAALKLRLFLANRKREEADTLPEGIGTVKADSITLESTDGKPLRAVFGNRNVVASNIHIESVPTRARILMPRTRCVKAEPKESLRIQNLPTDGDLVSFYSKKPLPLVPIAAESSFAELFTKLRESSKITVSYALLLVVSVLMATTGLFQNSSPTIIGAMILAPLMAPIVAFSMGAVRFDGTLLSRSAKTIALSAFTALAASAALAWLLPFTQVTAQMQMRTHPTLLDLAVAILAGVAAAYGYTHSKVGESLAGVAIAVALVPPLCVAGIGIGYGDWHIFANAFLLFLANIAGIVIASGTVFYLLGYASRRYASAAFFIKLLMVAAIGVPLWLSTRTLLADAKIYETFSHIQTLLVDDVRVQLHLRSLLHKEGHTYAEVYVISERGLTPRERAEIARRIRESIGEEVGLIFTYQELYR